MQKVKVAVVGLGAIGAVAASQLDDRLVDTTLCRKDRTSTVVVTRDDTAEAVMGRVCPEPESATRADWIILATKATHDASAWMRSLVTPTTRIAVFQNGIDVHDRVARWVPKARCLPVTVNISAERTSLDEVTIRHFGNLSIPSGPLATEFRSLFKPGLRIVERDDYEAEAWRKLLLNTVVNSLTTLTGGTSNTCLQPNLVGVTKALLSESRAVAEAVGVQLTPADEADVLTRISSFPSITSSMQWDYRHGNPLEHEFITGAVLRRAGEAGVEVPTVRSVHAFLDELSRHRGRLATSDQATITSGRFPAADVQPASSIDSARTASNDPSR